MASFAWRKQVALSASVRSLSMRSWIIVAEGFKTCVSRYLLQCLFDGIQSVLRLATVEQLLSRSGLVANKFLSRGYFYLCVSKLLESCQARFVGEFA